MHLAKVVGKIVSTQKVTPLVGSKLLVIKPVDEKLSYRGSEPVYVALDRVDAGVGDIVLVEWGDAIDPQPSMTGDMSIVGIVDTIQTEE